MKRPALLFTLLLAFSLSANAQGGTSGRIRYGSTLPSVCSPSTGDLFFLTSGTLGLYECLSTNTWTRNASGGGSGTVNVGVAGQLAYYATSGSAVSGLASAISVPLGGTGVTSFAAGDLLFGNGTSAVATSDNLNYNGSILKVGNNKAITVPYSTTGTNVTTELYGAGITVTNDQTFNGNGGGTGSATIVNGSPNATIISGYSFTSADIGKSFAVFTGSFFGSPFFSSTIASVTNSTHVVMTGNSNLSLTAQPFILQSLLNNLYSVVVGEGASTASSASTVVGYGACGAASSQFPNNGLSGSPYGGYAVSVGVMAGCTNGNGFGTSIGSFTETTDPESVAIGPSSKAYGKAAFAIGDKAESLAGLSSRGAEYAYCDACRLDGYQVIKTGGGGHYTHDFVIAFDFTNQVGNQAGGNTDFANNQMLIGGVNLVTPSASGIRDVWTGNGDVGTNGDWTNATPFGTTFHSTGGAGSNVSGAIFGIAGGISTGNATPGTIILQTSTPISSGAAEQTLATRMTVATSAVTVTVPIHDSIAGGTFVEQKLITVASVDMNTATATTLYTCPTGKTCVITKVIVRNASTNLTTVSASFGWTATAYTDWSPTLTFGALSTSANFRLVSPISGAIVGASTGIFKTLNNVLQGSAATTTMDVFGYVF